MRPESHLSKLLDQALPGIWRGKVSSLAAIHSGSDVDRALAHVTINALNTWHEFSRAYFLSCVLNPKRKVRAKVTFHAAGIKTFDDAIFLAARKCRGAKKPPKNRFDEPRWYKPNTVIDSCGELGCSHHADVVAALSTGSQVFNHLPVFRNFYAHRNAETLGLAQSVALHYAIPATQHPTNILSTYAGGRPQPILVDWLDDILLAMTMLCE